jgi:hypothetical protein
VTSKRPSGNVTRRDVPRAKKITIPAAADRSDAPRSRPSARPKRTTTRPKKQGGSSPRAVTEEVAADLSKDPRRDD